MTLSPAEHVSKLLHGEQSLESYAVAHHLDVSELRTWKALYLAGGQAAFAKRSTRSYRHIVVAVALAALVPLTVFAQSICSPTLPAPLTTFCSNSPASATQVNANFAVLAAKVMGAQPDGGTFNGDIIQAPGSTLRSNPVIADLRVAAAGVQFDGPNGGGRALAIEPGDVLALGSGFSATRVTGAATVTGALSAGGLLTATGGVSTSSLNGISLGVVGNELKFGETSGGANLSVWGELRANAIRNRGCYWADGGAQQRDAWSQASCGAGYYMQSTRCMVQTGSFIWCQAYCCLP